MQNKTYKFHSDSGHGWLAVKVKDLIELGIEKNISHYSYINGKTAYLEEDCDITIFFNAYKKKYSVDPKMTDLGQRSNTSKIRYYQSYNLTERA